MALARCILGKFLGVVCHWFPLPLDVPTFAARCLHVPINASAPSSERRPYIHDVKFMALLGAPYIYDISRLRVNYVTDQPSKSCMGCNCVNHEQLPVKVY
jgi:hypothetical protein